MPGRFNKLVNSCILSLLLFAACFFAFGAGTLQAGGWTQPQKGLYAKLCYLSSSASAYREPNGEEVMTFKSFDSLRGETRGYATDFSGNGFGLCVEYGLLESLTLTLDLPFSTFSLKETYSIDSKHFDYETRRSMSVTQASWTGIGARLQLLKTDRFVLSAVCIARIPSGFSSPDTGRADFPFLSDGALQLIGGAEFGYAYNGGWLEAEALYNKRGDDFKDEILLHLESGFSNIPRTHLKLFADAAISTRSFEGVRPFNPAQSQLQETNYNAGGSFTAYILGDWFVDISYTIRIYGLNSWNINALCIGGGVKIPDARQLF